MCGLYTHTYASGFTPSLPLQMALYFNVVFFPFWLVTIITMLQVKFECLSHIYRFIVVTVIVAVIVIEFLRLYLGYLGNFTEQVNAFSTPRIFEIEANNDGKLTWRR